MSSRDPFGPFPVRVWCEGVRYLFWSFIIFFYEERYRLVGQVGGYHRCGVFLLSWGLKTLHFLGHLFLVFYLYLSGYHLCFLFLIIDFFWCVSYFGAF